MSDFKANILKGRVALITGGATGIGKEIARTLGKHGAKIVITSRKQENLDAACQEFKKEGIDSLAVPSDVRNPEAVEKVIASAIEKYGSARKAAPHLGMDSTSLTRKLKKFS